jgi:hypothetical protein
MGDVGGDCQGLLGDELKGTDHVSGYREFAGFRLGRGRVLQVRQAGMKPARQM